jgi:hypothetical protein
VSKKNRHGLKRAIPEDVKREIRRRCGFGCVVCGLGYYEYEHFNPDFKDAKEHSAEGMTLLCSQCNQKRARKTLSVETVVLANGNPKCKQAGFASERYDFWTDPVEVKIGGLTFLDCAALIRVNGVDILSFRAPENEGEPVRFSGFFSDNSGDGILNIVDNVWHAGGNSWDIETVGPVITFRRALGDISLKIRVKPPGAIVVEKIDMVYDGVFFRGGENFLSISFNGRDWQKFIGCNAIGGDVGISIRSAN